MRKPILSNFDYDLDKYEIELAELTEDEERRYKEYCDKMDAEGIYLDKMEDVSTWKRDTLSAGS